LVGYGLGVYEFRGRRLVFSLVLLVLVVPIQILILPLYNLLIVFKSMNTFRGIIAPFIVSPFAVFFFRQYVIGIPMDFIDAGRIDGLSEGGIFFRIMSPLMMPAFGAMAILGALQSWNNFLWPLIVLRTGDMFTLPIGLASLLSSYGNNYDMLISGSLMATLPIILIFFIFQRYFIAGLTAGGIKA
jgi:arabinosaccharide transport system permease protein